MTCLGDTHDTGSKWVCHFVRFLFSFFFAVSFFFTIHSSVYAAALTSVSNVPWSSDISVAGKHTVKFTTVTAVPANGKIVITFPSGFAVSSATFDSWSGFDGGRSISISDQVITITRDNTGTSSTAGAKYIVLAGITNNSTAASTYTVTVETQDSSSSTLDGATTSDTFSVTAVGDELDTTSPWPMRGHDNRNSFSSAATAPDYPTLSWKFNFADNDYHTGAVEDSNGIVYIGGTSNLYALNSDGTTKWSVTQSRGTVAGMALTKNSRLVIWYRGGPIESRNISDGALVWSYTSSVGGNDAGSLSIGPDGSIFVSTNTLGIEAINSDGTRKFYNSAVSARDSTPAVDNATGQIYTTDDGPATSINPDGTVKWNTGGPGSVGNPAQLNSSGSIVCMEGRAIANATMCLNTSNGATVWSATTASTGYGQGAFSPDDSIFYTMYNTTSVSARNATTGVANWTQTYAGGFGYAGGGNLMVDATNRIYAGRQAFNSDGTSRWTLSSTGSPIPIIGISNTMAYYDRVGNLYNYKPWTLSGSLDSNTHVSGETVTITATSSMLRVDPASSNNNLVQAVMANGDKVILTYDSASGGNTIWKGTYTVPGGTTSGPYTGTIQAAAYNVTTDVTTTFNSLPTGFNNTGITATFCYGVNAQAANCGSNSITDVGVETTKTTAKISWKTTNNSSYTLSWGESTTYGNTTSDGSVKDTSHSVFLSDLQSSKTYHFQLSSKDITNNSVTTGDLTFSTSNPIPVGWQKPISFHAQETGMVSDNSRSTTLVWITNTNSFPFETYLALNGRTDGDLTLGNTDHQVKVVPLSQSGTFSSAGNTEEITPFSSFNGARLDGILKPYTVILSLDAKKIIGQSDSVIKIAWWNQISRAWEVLPNSVINRSNNQIAVATTKTGFFAPVIGFERLQSQTLGENVEKIVEPLVTPTPPEPTHDVKLKQETKPKPKFCFWFLCF